MAQAAPGAAADAAPILAWQTLALGLRDVQPLARQVALGELKMDGAELLLARGAKGRFNLQSLLAATASPPTDAAADAAQAPAPTEPWQLSLDALRLNGGLVSWTDDAVRPRAALQLADLNLLATGLHWPATPLTLTLTLSTTLRTASTAAAAAGRLTLNGRLTASTINWTGRFGLAPLQVDGQLTLQSLPLHLLAPYAADALPVSLLHADTGFQGRVTARQTADGWRVGSTGDQQVTELKVNTRAAAGGRPDSGDDLLTWQPLALLARPGLKLTVTGAADPATDRTALLLALLKDRLQAERAREPLRPAATPPPTRPVSASAMDAVPQSHTPPRPGITSEDRARLLKALYQKTALPDKPRNAFGLLRGDLPATEMEALLLAAMPASDDTARDLALQRGRAVRDALVARKLPSERLVPAAPQLHVAADAGTFRTPQVNLSLSTH